MGCCCSSEEKKLFLRLEAAVEKFGLLFEAVLLVCLLDSDGTALVSIGAEQDPELMQKIISMKKTASQFGATLVGGSCSVIKIRGGSQLYSCYDLNQHHLSMHQNIQVGQESFVSEDQVEEAIEERKDVLVLLNDAHSSTSI